jgi:nicotinamidase/pyrazinamidase
MSLLRSREEAEGGHAKGKFTPPLNARIVAAAWQLSASSKRLGAGEPMNLTSQDVLLVIDVQNDFCPGGALAVPEGDQVIAPILHAAQYFEHAILTQDWHSPAHASFASAHPGKQPYDQVELSYGPQTLWPDHCVQQTPGAEFHRDLKLPRAELILRKGFRSQIDSYSAFFENDRTTATGLAGYLREAEPRLPGRAGL